MASPQSIANSCAFLIKVYGSRAKTQLGDDLAKELLFSDLEEYSDEEVAHGMTLLRRGQENVFADGHSIYAVILKWVKAARKELVRSRRANEQSEKDLEVSRQLRQAAAEMTPEKMAVNRMRISLIRQGRLDEAHRLATMTDGEAVRLVPPGQLAKARRLWDEAHAGKFKSLMNHEDPMPSPPPCPMIPERTEKGEE